MGSLTLPANGSIYLDTMTVIYSIETQPVYWPILKPLWISARDGKAPLVTSELTLMESLVAPLRTADTTLIAAYEELFRAQELQATPIRVDILREAARLRATIPGVRTPDAIHAATAQLRGCVMFLTNDAGFRRIPGLPVVLLDEILKS